MPVTARLSKRFYEVLGEDVANELVDWFNLVDATYRSDLRELNELNFARFDAKVEQRFAEFETIWERRFVGLESKVEQRTFELRQEILGLRADSEVAIERTRAELIRWMFLFWLGSVTASVLTRVL